MNSPNRVRVVWWAVGLVLAGGLGGCATSRWQESYVGTRDAAVGRERVRQNAPVRIRAVTWERVGKTLAELESMAAASDVHPDDWSPAQKAEAKAKLLKGLQITLDPSQVEILGRSDFRTTDDVRPDTPAGEAELAAFARSIGADTVMYSARSLGKADRIVREPVSVESFHDPLIDRRDDGLPGWYSHRSFAWVPVRVQAEELGFVAFFLRTRE